MPLVISQHAGMRKQERKRSCAVSGRTSVTWLLRYVSLTMFLIPLDIFLMFSFALLRRVVSMTWNFAE